MKSEDSTESQELGIKRIRCVDCGLFGYQGGQPFNHRLMSFASDARRHQRDKASHSPLPNPPVCAAGVIERFSSDGYQVVKAEICQDRLCDSFVAYIPALETPMDHVLHDLRLKEELAREERHKADNVIAQRALDETVLAGKRSADASMDAAKDARWSKGVTGAGIVISILALTISFGQWMWPREPVKSNNSKSVRQTPVVPEEPNETSP